MKFFDSEFDSSDRVLAPLRLDDPGLPLRVRRGLLALGYNGEAVQAALAGYHDAGGRLPPATPLACLIRAFVLHVPTPEEDMRRHMGSELFDLCDTAGLWSRGPDGVTGSAVLMVDGKTFLLSDHGDTRLGELAMHWVMGIGTSTMKLAHSVAKRPYQRVLDLCCGAGIHAFMTSPHAREVVAVDRNPRALNYGRFGAAMSKFTNVSFRESDCYSAVAGETFDLIICNPPYVLTPDRQTYYRDGGMGGDRFAEKVLREAPRHLRESGVAHIMCDVAAIDGKSSEQRLRGWLDGSGCDVIALHSPPVEAAAYARNWLRKDDRIEEEQRWVASFAELGIASVTNFLVILRKREGAANWFRLDAFGGSPAGPYGHQVARLFAAEDLTRRGDDFVGQAKLRVPGDVRLLTAMRAEAGKWAAESALLRFTGGLPWERPVRPELAAALARLDGKRPAAEVMTDPGAARELLLQGVLEPVA